MGLKIELASDEDFRALGHEGWPLAHYLLRQPEADAPNVWATSRIAPLKADDVDERRAALEALIISAFES